VLTLAEAADRLGVGPEQVRRYAIEGRLAHWRGPNANGPYRIPEDAVNELTRAPDARRGLYTRIRALEERVDALASALSQPATPRPSDTDVLAELGRLRAENTRLKESETALAAAAAAEHEAADALASALDASTKAERARSRAAAGYEAALAAYRRPGHLGDM
jgi:excisionase family DNA binding protein